MTSEPELAPAKLFSPTQSVEAVLGGVDTLSKPKLRQLSQVNKPRLSTDAGHNGRSLRNTR